MTDLLWGLWNGFSVQIVLIAHVFGWWDRWPVYDSTRDGGWYSFGFLLCVMGVDTAILKALFR